MHWGQPCPLLLFYPPAGCPHRELMTGGQAVKQMEVGAGESLSCRCSLIVIPVRATKLDTICVVSILWTQQKNKFQRGYLWCALAVGFIVKCWSIYLFIYFFTLNNSQPSRWTWSDQFNKEMLESKMQKVLFISFSTRCSGLFGSYHYGIWTQCFCTIPGHLRKVCIINILQLALQPCTTRKGPAELQGVPDVTGQEVVQTQSRSSVRWQWLSTTVPLYRHSASTNYNNGVTTCSSLTWSMLIWIGSLVHT